MPSDNPKELDPEIILIALGVNPAHTESRRSALVKLYMHYQSHVRHAVGRAITRTGYRGSAEDIRQDVWCYLVRPNRGALRFYDPDRGSFRLFIKRVAYQRALVEIRRELRLNKHTATTSTFEDDIEDPRAERTFAKLLQNEDFTKVITLAANNLSESEIALLRDIYGNGRSFLSVANEQGAKVNTIHKRTERIRNKLRQWAAKLDPVFSGPMEISHMGNPSLGANGSTITVSLSPRWPPPLTPPPTPKRPSDTSPFPSTPTGFKGDSHSSEDQRSSIQHQVQRSSQGTPNHGHTQIAPSPRSLSEGDNRRTIPPPKSIEIVATVSPGDQETANRFIFALRASFPTWPKDTIQTIRDYLPSGGPNVS